MSITLGDFRQHIIKVKDARELYEAAVAAHERAGTDPKSLTLKVEHRDRDHMLVFIVSGIKDGEVYDWADLYEQ